MRGRDRGFNASDLRIAEVTKMDTTVENGKVSSFRTRVALSCPCFSLVSKQLAKLDGAS